MIKWTHEDMMMQLGYLQGGLEQMEDVLHDTRLKVTAARNEVTEPAETRWDLEDAVELLNRTQFLENKLKGHVKMLIDYFRSRDRSLFE